MYFAPPISPALLRRFSTRCWYVQLGKKQLRLSPDREEAFQIYYDLMSRGSEGPNSSPKALSTSASTLVVEVLDTFLDWCGQNRAGRTYHFYLENIQRFATRVAADLTVEELKPFHVTRAMADFPNWGNNTKYDFIGVLSCALNWAVDEELIERNPLARMKKPTRESREMAVTPEEYVRIMGTIEEPHFRDLIEISWETGSRVQELRKLEARFVDLMNGRILLPPSKAKGKKHYRVIYLTDRAGEIVTRLCKEAPAGPLLRNSEGNPWTKDAINNAFCRLQLALGRRAMRELGLEPSSPTSGRRALRTNSSRRRRRSTESRCGKVKRIPRSSSQRMARSTISCLPQGVRHRGLEKRGRYRDLGPPSRTRGRKHGQPSVRQGSAGPQVYVRGRASGKRTEDSRKFWCDDQLNRYLCRLLIPVAIIERATESAPPGGTGWMRKAP